ILLAACQTTQHLFLFTNKGNVIYRPVHELTDIRWKDLGEHLSQSISNFGQEEEVVFAQVVSDFEAGTYVVASRSGQIKRLALADLKPWRTYKSKATV
ncbi:DNA topoisomerase IV subunit A, partial [Streptococcus danieliae]|nr:DNA topoisomerase IV subunit A [Streptococcus danieliae]